MANVFYVVLITSLTIVNEYPPLLYNCDKLNTSTDNQSMSCLTSNKVARFDNMCVWMVNSDFKPYNIKCTKTYIYVLQSKILSTTVTRST